MKRFDIVLTVIIFLIGSGAALSANPLEGIVTEADADAFSLSVPLDAGLLSVGAGLVAAEFFIDPAEGVQTPRENLIFPDKFTVFEYNSGADLSSDILFFTSLLFPASLVAGQGFDSILETGVMFVETILLTQGTKQMIKTFVPRYRPYTYWSEPMDDDYADSFPSGHTALTFAVCSFSAYTFGKLFPESEWKTAFGIASYSVATAVAVLRVVSGSHFASDVLTGALIGTAFGIGVPAVHGTAAGKDQPPAVPKLGFSGEGVTLAFRI